MLLGAFFPREDKVQHDIDDHVQGLGVYGGINNPHSQPLVLRNPISNLNVVGHTLPNG